MKRGLIPALAGLLAGCILCFPLETVKAATDACRLWASNVLPALFPFLICALFITGGLRGKGKNGLSRLTGMPAALTPILALGWLSGSPGGARLSQEVPAASPGAYRRFALYSGTMSPMFFVGTLGGWLRQPVLGWVMLAAHLIGALAVGQLSRLLYTCPPPAKMQQQPAASPPTLAQVLNGAAMAMLLVCGLMMLGSVAAQMIRCAFPALKDIPLAAVQAFLEVTAGCSRLAALPLPEAFPALRPAILCAAASFGGLSILLQNLSFLQGAGVTFPFLLMGRLAHGLISFLLCLLFLLLAGPIAARASAPILQTPQAPSAIPLAAWLACMMIPAAPRRKKLFS